MGCLCIAPSFPDWDWMGKEPFVGVSEVDTVAVFLLDQLLPS